MKKQRAPVSTFILLTVILISAIGAIWFYLFEPFRRDPETLPHITPLPLESAVFFREHYAALDKKLAEQLLPLGLELRETSTHPTQQEGIRLWEQKIIEIPFPEELSRSVLIKTLHKAVEPFSPAVTCEVHPGIAASEFSVNISISGIPSHKIKFFPYTALNLAQKQNGHAAIIIDDIGNNYNLSLDVLSIKAPLTVSILPFSQYGLIIAEQAHASGREIMLHLPMEAKNGTINNRDSRHLEHFLLTDMPHDAIIKQTIKCIESVPYIAGINNHMGSRFTENERCIKTVLQQIQKRQLFFIDSLTTEQSKGFQIARSMGIKTGRRDIFLDNEDSYLATVNQLEQLLILAMSSGTAIGIGHPYPSTIHAINTMLPEFAKRGVTLVPVSQLLE